MNEIFGHGSPQDPASLSHENKGAATPLEELNKLKEQISLLQQQLTFLGERLNNESAPAPPHSSASVPIPESSGSPEVLDGMVEELWQKITSAPLIKQMFEDSKNKVYEQFPVLNCEKGKFFLELYADMLGEELSEEIPVLKIYEMAAHDICDFISAVQSSTPQAEKPVEKIQEKLQAFAEGSGNLVPQVDPYDSALKKAKKTGSVEDLIRLKLKKIQEK
jgi:hypothetical protein